MAKKKKEIKLLSEEQEKELQDMVNGMLDLAAEIVNDHDDLDLEGLEAISGSVTQINVNSPFLDEIFTGDSWKRVITNMNKIKEKPKNSDDDVIE